MNYSCPLCELVPSSHSLKKITDKNGNTFFYTCPSQATLYYDVTGIVNHYDGVLSELGPNEEWVWIFDSQGFGLAHAMQTSVAIELAKLISNKFSNNLKKIIIINPTFYITLTHKLIMPFLGTRVRELIEINYETKRAEEILL